MKTFNKKLIRVFNRKANGDTDEVSGLGKGARWAIFAILIAVVVAGVGIFIANYQDNAGRVNTQMEQLQNSIDTAENTI